MIFDPAKPADARALERLRDPKTLTAWFTTVTPDGRPQSTPVWFLWLEDQVLVYGDHRAKRNRNLDRNPHVNLHLNEDEGGGLVVIQGTARIDADHPQAVDHEGYLAKYGDLIDKWFKGPAGFSQIYSMPILITPTRGTAWVG